MLKSEGVGLMVWSPLAGGLLTGKYRRGEPLPTDTRFNENMPAFQRKRYNDRVFDVVEGIEPIAEAKECSISQLALAWTMQQPGVTSPIIGPRTMEQFDDNMGALRITLNEDDLKTIDAIASPGDSVSTYYEADFGPHQFRV